MSFRSMLWGVAPLCLWMACASDSEVGKTRPYSEDPDPATGNNTGGDDDDGANTGADAEEDAGDVPAPARDAGGSTPMDASMGPPDPMTTPDAGPKPDAGNTMDSGTSMDSGMMADSGTVDSGTVDSGTQVDAGTPVDSGTEVDAGPPADSGTPTDGGGEVDSGPPLDAGEPVDSGTETDAGDPTDAGPGTDGGDIDAGPPCGTEGLVAGNDCVGVVTCQDEGFTQQPVLECVLTGSTPSRCCTTPIGAQDSCRTTACAANDNEATCDGPEDCAGNTAGAVCCFNAGDAACAATCTNPNTMCHKDADCPTGSTCEAGSNAQGRYSWWGFCRGT